MPRPKGSKNKSKTNIRQQRINTTRYKKGFRKPGSTASYYHNSVPRTLQVATRRPNSTTLRFVKNLTYEIDPQITASAQQWNYHLSFRANSIYDIIKDNGLLLNANSLSPVVKAQDPEYNPTGGLIVNADGWDRYRLQYQHFTVLGSKIQTTCQPMTWSSSSSGDNEIAPTTAYIQLSGVDGQISRASPMRELVKKPYLKRAQIIASVGGGGTMSAGVRLYQFYSARKFEGVNDVMDNNNLRGRFANPNGNGASPQEQTYYNIGFVNTINQATYPQVSADIKRPPKMLMRVKLEYIVKLTEPTDTNDVTQ